MKAIIMSHENGGSYCIDNTGSFHFVKGYQDKAIGTEITIQVKKPARIRRFYLACAVFFVAALAIGLMCTLKTQSYGFMRQNCVSSETACQSPCAYYGEDGCSGRGRCDFSCAGN